MSLRTFFVYGTLMTGCVNHHVIGEEAIEHVVPAKLQQMDLYMCKGAYYPGMIRGTGEVVGELITIKAPFFERIVKRVDRLEGYIGEGDARNEYDKIIAEVEIENEQTIRAYCYLFNVQNGELGEKINSGNFRLFIGSK